MSNKTCGECKFHCKSGNFCSHHGIPWLTESNGACKDFEPIPKQTNGDKIIAGGMRAIAKFALHHCCNNCIYFDGNNPYRSTCGKPDNENCEDGVEAWLNAPAEREGEDE